MTATHGKPHYDAMIITPSKTAGVYIFDWNFVLMGKIYKKYPTLISAWMEIARIFSETATPKKQSPENERRNQRKGEIAAGAAREGKWVYNSPREDLLYRLGVHG